MSTPAKTFLRQLERETIQFSGADEDDYETFVARVETEAAWRNPEDEPEVDFFDELVAIVRKIEASRKERLSLAAQPDANATIPSPQVIAERRIE